jgi:hypothetical protein
MTNPSAAYGVHSQGWVARGVALKNNPGVRWGLWSRFPCWT